MGCGCNGTAHTTMTPRSDPCPSCGLNSFERNRYFDGKLLTARDMTAEQTFLTGKNRLHNSRLHGVGTVCGLKVVQHENDACLDKYVLLEPGLALDCRGNEILVPEQVQIDIHHQVEAAQEGENAATFTDGQELFIHLAYRECDTEKTPALLDDCGCGDGATEFSRTREGFEVFFTSTAPTGQAGDAVAVQLEW